MARRTKTVTITAGTPQTNRDHGKQFFLTEMPAAEAEEIAIRVLGARFADAVMNFGMAGIAVIGVPAIYAMPYDEAKPLWDRIMACVKPVGMPQAPITLSADDVIEEVATRLQLRLEVLELHLGFSFAAARSALFAMAQTSAAISETTETSPLASPPPSAAG